MPSIYLPRGSNVIVEVGLISCCFHGLVITGLQFIFAGHNAIKTFILYCFHIHYLTLLFLHGAFHVASPEDLRRGVMFFGVALA